MILPEYVENKKENIVKENLKLAKDSLWNNIFENKLSNGKNSYFAKEHTSKPFTKKTKNSQHNVSIGNSTTPNSEAWQKWTSAQSKCCGLFCTLSNMWKEAFCENSWRGSKKLPIEVTALKLYDKEQSWILKKQLKKGKSRVSRNHN